VVFKRVVSQQGSSGFNYLKHASDYGLTVSSFDKDFPAVVQRRTIASDMSKGVQF
jgi:dihydrolipoamide dehydrogenase